MRIEKFWPKNRSLGKFLTLGLLSVVVFINLTFASNITLNTGQPIQFGQGIVLTTTCDTYLTVKITREYDAATNSFTVKDLILGDISTKLHSKRVSLALRNDATDTILTSSNLYFDLDASGIVFTSPLAHTDSINYSSTSAYGANEIGTSSITFTNIRKTDNSKIPADDVSRVLFESSKGGGCTAPTISCATVSSTCQLGSIGPGGGPVIYIAATPFTEPVTGNTYKYIEAAPAYWIAGVIDPNTSPCGSLSFATTLSSNIGYARSNTTALLTDGSCAGDLTSTSPSTVPNGSLRAAALVRSYGSDWNLPTFNELIEICKIARFGAAAAATKATCDAAGGTSPASGYLSNKYVASSKGSMAGQINTVDLGTGALNTDSAPINLSYRVRPIRYFN